VGKPVLDYYVEILKMNTSFKKFEGKNKEQSN